MLVNSRRPRRSATADPPLSGAERLRRRFAEIWGEMGRQWGVVPAVTATHGYVLIAGRAVSANDVRAALGLSHAAVVQAFKQLQDWGLIVPGPDAPRTGRRGPRARTWTARGDPWTWFPQVIRERKQREGDPVVAALEGLLAETSRPDDPELDAVHAWLAEFLEFVRRFQRLAGLLAATEPQEFARAVALLSALPDETVHRLVHLVSVLGPEEAVELAAAVASVEPRHARRVARAVRGALRVRRALGSARGRAVVEHDVPALAEG